MGLQDYIAEQIAKRPIEATLVRKVYKALKKAGTPIVSGYDYEEKVSLTSQQDVLNFAFNLDEFYLYTSEGAMVRMSMGQGAEGLVDYSMSLEKAFDDYGLNEWIDKKMD